MSRWADLSRMTHEAPGYNSSKMLPDPGCYEERYRLTSGATARLAAGLASVAIGLRWQAPSASAPALILAIPVLLSALGLACALPGLITIARRLTAFRADYAGITLADMPTSLATLRRPALFIPWAEVDRIILYRARPAAPDEAPPIQGIAVQCRDAAPAQLGRATRTTRKITGWRLDRERLTEVTAAVAPAVTVVDAGPPGPSRR
jgi:hypothetical protein